MVEQSRPCALRPPVCLPTQHLVDGRSACRCWRAPAYSVLFIFSSSQLACCETVAGSLAQPAESYGSVSCVLYGSQAFGNHGICRVHACVAMLLLALYALDSIHSRIEPPSTLHSTSSCWCFPCGTDTPAPLLFEPLDGLVCFWPFLPMNATLSLQVRLTFCEPLSFRTDQYPWSS